MKSRPWLILCLLAALGAATVPAGSEPQQRATNRDRSARTALNEEGYPLNVEPVIVSAADAGIADNDLVMGIVHNGEARAYPVNYMKGPLNEVVNDRLGGTAIAPSW